MNTQTNFEAADERAPKRGLARTATSVALSVSMLMPATVFGAQEAYADEASETDCDLAVGASEEETPTVDAVAQEVKAAETVEECKAAVGTAQKAYDQASAEYTEASNQYNAAVSAKDEAKQASDTADEQASSSKQAAYDALSQQTKEAEEAAAAAATELETAKSDLSSAQETATQKEQACADAQKAVEDANAALEKAKQDAEDQAASTEDSQAVKDAKAQVAKAESALSEAQQAKADADAAVADAQAAVDAVNEKAAAANEEAKQGSLGFIDWMQSQDGLTEKQKYDLSQAKTVIEKAEEESFSDWAYGDGVDLAEGRNGKVTVVGDEKDATALANLQKSITIMKKINELRASDENFDGDMQCNDSLTNFYFMAVAQTGADRGAGLHNHSLLQVSCENLAFGYTDPTIGWYNEEKKDFDQIKSDLGITDINKTTLAQIEQEAEKRDVVIGHYTNLFWSADQVMGVGYTQYSRTSCYNASTYGGISKKYETYTISEFEELLSKYQAHLDEAADGLAEAQAALEAAQAKQAEAATAVTDAEANVAAAEAAVKEAQDAQLAEQSAEVAKAQTALDEAKAAAEQANADSKEAADAVTAAEQTVSEKQQNVDAANAKLAKLQAVNADDAFANGIADEELSDLNDLFTAARDAQTKADEAKAALEAAEAEAGKFSAEYVAALLNYQFAEANLRTAQAAYDAAIAQEKEQQEQAGQEGQQGEQANQADYSLQPDGEFWRVTPLKHIQLHGDAKSNVNQVSADQADDSAFGLPKTGDETPLAALIAALGATALGGIILSLRKLANREN